MKPAAQLREQTINRACTRCRVSQPLSEYHRSARSSDGHRYVCKICSRQEYRQKYVRKRPVLTLIERFERLIVPEPNSGCWLWLGYVNAAGYGNIDKKSYGTGWAHRAAYELFIDKIPSNLEIDHKCRVTSCVNPQHLRIVTTTENLACRKIRRGRYLEQCRNGHAYTPENTSFVTVSDIAYRKCRTCRQASQARYLAKRYGDAV